MRRRTAAGLCFLWILALPMLSAAEGIRWQPYKEGLAQAKSEQKKIFVNFHADW